jgi:hypothetical protein
MGGIEARRLLFRIQQQADPYWMRRVLMQSTLIVAAVDVRMALIATELYDAKEFRDVPIVEIICLADIAELSGFLCLRERPSKGWQPICQPHVFSSSLQITPKPTTSTGEMTKFFENIERQFKFIVLYKLSITAQKRRMLLLVACRQSMSRTLKQCFGNLPALDRLCVGHPVL